MQIAFSILNVMGGMTEISTSQSVSEMLRGCSIEIGPTHPKMLDAALERLEPGTEVFLPWIPGANPMDAVLPAARLRRAGLIPVPHIGARHLESGTQLDQFIARLVGDAGVDRALVVGGDRAKPAGPYESSLEVMQTGVFQKAGIVRIAIGGFPEGNPHIPLAVLDEALSAKMNFARSVGLKLSIVTQFAFAAGPIIKWLKEVRSRGIDVPVQIGLAGPAGIVSLMRFAVRCGIGNSLHVLAENPSFAKLLVEKGPEPIIRDVCAAAQTEGDSLALGIAGLHFYVFGGFNKTVDWIEAHRAANFHSAHT